MDDCALLYNTEHHEHGVGAGMQPDSGEDEGAAAPYDEFRWQGDEEDSMDVTIAPSEQGRAFGSVRNLRDRL